MIFSKFYSGLRSNPLKIKNRIKIEVYKYLSIGVFSDALRSENFVKTERVYLETSVLKFSLFNLIKLQCVIFKIIVVS